MTILLLLFVARALRDHPLTTRLRARWIGAAPFTLRRIRRLVAVLLLTNHAVTARAQDEPGYRDPRLALAAAVVMPGAGHLYAGEPGKGALFFTTTVVAPVAGALLTLRSEKRVCDTEGCSSSANLLPFFLGAAASFGVYGYSIADAPKAAARTNRRLRARRATVSPLLAGMGRSDAVVGVHMSLTF